MTNTEQRAREVVARAHAQHGGVKPWWWDADFDDGADETAVHLRDQDLLAADDILAALTFAPPTTGGDVTHGDETDRIAAAEYVSKAFGEQYRHSVLNEGRWPDLVEAFRRHRLAALATAQAGEGELDSYEKFDGVGPHAETIETRARIGERYLEAYESALTDPRLAGYMPADCPSELLIDLLNGTWLAHPTTDSVSREAVASEPLDRSPPQFFFEVGYGACWAEAFVRNGSTPPFPLTDAVVERAWEIAREAYDDPEEFDRYLSALRALPAAQAGRVDVESEPLTRIVKFVENYWAPWGSWKTAWWEGEVSDDAAFSAENALKHVSNIAAAALSPPSADGEEGVPTAPLSSGLGEQM